MTRPSLTSMSWRRSWPTSVLSLNNSLTLDCTSRKRGATAVTKTHKHHIVVHPPLSGPQFTYYSEPLIKDTLNIGHLSTVTGNACVKPPYRRAFAQVDQNNRITLPTMIESGRLMWKAHPMLNNTLWPLNNKGHLCVKDIQYTVREMEEVLFDAQQKNTWKLRIQQSWEYSNNTMNSL